jgi:hypothetical protein
VEKAWAIVSMLKGCGADLNKRAKGESPGPARKVSIEGSRVQDLISWPSALKVSIELPASDPRFLLFGVLAPMTFCKRFLLCFGDVVLFAFYYCPQSMPPLCALNPTP